MEGGRDGRAHSSGHPVGSGAGAEGERAGHAQWGGEGQGFLVQWRWEGSPGEATVQPKYEGTRQQGHCSNQGVKRELRTQVDGNEGKRR